ncbi:DinB family protein [uncultured Dokdonia sp.]|uniref:DinB family protein n=1 Tax=uncultured Dokdonia sp. TaxID=575653 RepID=UPI00262C66A0|nr:DinB family protein [uncultured Dokdonia sp.]
MNTTIQYYSQQLEAINHKSLWIGQNVIEKIDGISEKIAFIRPIPELHSVAELIGHLTALHIDLINKIRIKHGLQEIYRPNDWRSNNELQIMGWEQIKKDYEKIILSLSVFIRDKPDSFLEETYMEKDYKSSNPFEYILEGAIHHTLYHLGQIGITIKLLITKELHV